MADSSYESWYNGLHHDKPAETMRELVEDIANRYGDLNYLPAYVIGGDNREFFRKVFIYLGKFRNHISPELLGKLYDYVSKQ